MKRLAAVRALCGAVVLLAALAAVAQVAVPALSARVTDLTAILTSEQKAALEQTLAAFEQRKGSQIAVLIVPTTAPETIEQYSLRVVEQWKLGRKGVDDGALLLIARDDRKLRIEAGYGLEGALNDAVCKRIVDEIIVPHLRQGDFYGGIAAGVERMIAVIDGEALPARRGVTLQTSTDPIYGYLDAVWILVVFGPVFLLMVVLVLLALSTEPPKGGWHSGGRSSHDGSGGSRGGGGWFGGGGGGGFSGGGGGFGGGGASGGW